MNKCSRILPNWIEVYFLMFSIKPLYIYSLFLFLFLPVLPLTVSLSSKHSDVCSCVFTVFIDSLNVFTFYHFTVFIKISYTFLLMTFALTFCLYPQQPRHTYSAFQKYVRMRLPMRWLMACLFVCVTLPTPVILIKDICWFGWAPPV